MKPTKLIALDVGEKRIGVAAAESTTKLAYPLTTIAVDGSEVETLHRLFEREGADIIVVGYPRNQSGEATAQTAYVEAFVARLDPTTRFAYQDESLTSVEAERRLKATKKPYEKSDIDSYAAAIILTDYVEAHYV